VRHGMGAVRNCKQMTRRYSAHILSRARKRVGLDIASVGAFGYYPLPDSRGSEVFAKMETVVLSNRVRILSRARQQAGMP